MVIEDFEIEEVIKDNVQESENLGNTNSNDSEVDLRKKLGILAEDLYRKKVVSDESYYFLKTLSSAGESGDEEDLKMLKKVHEYNSGLQEKSKGHISLVDKAQQDGYITQKNADFLISEIVQHPDFVSKSFEAESSIKDKLKRLKDDMDQFDVLSNNPLLTKDRKLEIDEGISFDVPDRKKFLNMDIKERREYMKKVGEALKKAEKYAEESEKIESKEIDKKYSDKLEKFQNEDGVIGEHSVKEFKKWMEEIDGIEAKKNALKELHDNGGGQMERYKKLWTEIRKNLEGDELSDMEKMRDSNGYTEIFIEYGKSGKKLDSRYESELDKCVRSGDINEKTAGKFVNNPDGMKNITDLKEKYRYIRELPDQIDKYKKSHFEKDEPSEKKFDSAIDMSDPLTAVTDLTAKRGIQRTIDDLKKGGKEQTSSFLRIVKSVTRGGQQSDSYDASGFQSSLRKKREEKIEKEEVDEHETVDNNVIDFQQALREKREGKMDRKKRSWNPFAKKTKPEQVGEDQRGEVTDIESKRTSKSINKSEIKEDVDKLKEVSNAKVIDDRGFFEVQMDEERNTIADITRSEARDRLLFENQRRQYKGKQDGGKDSVTFAVKSEGGQSIELDLTQVRAMEKALEKEKVSDLDDVEYKKAS